MQSVRTILNIRRGGVFGLLLVAASVIVSGGHNAFATGLHITTSHSFEGFSPQDTRGEAYRYFIHGNVIETLVTLDDKGNVQPKLAESWNWNFDNDVLTMELRQGVVMHNGEQFTCDNVLRMLIRRPDVEVDFNRRYSVPMQPLIKRTNCTGSHTVRIEFEKPYKLALRDLASYRMGIYDKNDRGFVVDLFGTGPYRLENNSIDQITMKKNDRYWALPAKIDEITVQTILNRKNALEDLQSQSTDLLVIDDDPSMVQEMIDFSSMNSVNDRYMYHYGISDRHWVIGLNKDLDLLDNRNYRCGIKNTINSESIGEEIFYGKSWKLRGPQGVFEPYYFSIRDELIDPDLSESQVNMVRLKIEDRNQDVQILVEDTPVARAIARKVVQQAAFIDATLVPDVQSSDRYHRRFELLGDFEMVLFHTNDMFLPRYFHDFNQPLFNQNDQDYEDNLESAFHTFEPDFVSDARFVASIEFALKECQHLFLLQQPVFFVVNNRWQLPMMHMPVGNIPLAEISER